MKKGKGKVVAVVAGVSVVGVFVVALAFWRDIAVQFYLYRLNDPDYLPRIIWEPEGTIARRAVHQYFKSEKGQTVLSPDYSPGETSIDSARVARSAQSILCLLGA